MNYRILPFIFALMTLTGCDLDYWWSRGQPPASATLLERANSKFNSHLSATNRSDVKETVSKIQEKLLAMNAAISEVQVGATVTEQLSTLSATFSSLEGSLNWAQRASFGELSGQLAGFEQLAKNDQPISPDVFALFSARAIFFLGEELANPAP